MNKTAKQFFYFTCIGSIGTLFHYCTLILFVQKLRINPVLASGIGFGLGAFVNYSLNYRWTFKSHKRHKETITKFLFIAMIGLVLNSIILTLVIGMLQVHYLISQILATGIVLFWNFFVNKIWTFGEALSLPES
jgi:putative flippase GtrA